MCCICYQDNWLCIIRFMWRHCDLLRVWHRVSSTCLAAGHCFFVENLKNYSLWLRQLFIQRERSRMNLLSKDWPWNKVKCISLTLIPSCSHTLIFYSIGALTARTLYSSEQLKSRYVVTRAWRQGVTVHYFSSDKCSFKRTALEIDHWTSE
jgi:hypothetical protein